MPKSYIRLALDEEPTRDTIIQLRRAGYSWDLIGRTYNVSGPTVRNRAIEFGIIERSSFKCQRPKGDRHFYDAARIYPSPGAGHRVFRRLLPNHQYTKESEARDYLATMLQDAGREVRVEVLTRDGYVDILVLDAPRPLFVEVKIGTIRDCAQGIGQVLLYSYPYEHVQPVVAVPATIAQDINFISICKRVGVEVWSIEEVIDGRFRQPGQTQAPRPVGGATNGGATSATGGNG